MITLNTNLFKKIWKAFIHPVTMLVLGLTISLVFYLLSKSEKLPSYHITKPELIAKQVSEGSSLKISWDTLELQNLYFVNLTIWNNGNEYIDSEDFVENQPMMLHNTGDVRILSIVEKQKSRPEIRIGRNIDSLGSAAEFYLLDNEALEQNDGVTLHVLYSSLSRGNWSFEGRVKGAPKGFQEIDLRENSTSKSRTSIYILWGIFLSLIVLRILVLLIQKKPILFRNYEVVFFLLFLVQAIYLTVKDFYLGVYLVWY